MMRNRPRGTVELRISVTERCQLHCVYCAPADSRPAAERKTHLSFVEIVRFVRALSEAFRVTKIHLTGGEPLARRELPALVAKLAAESTAELAMTTNGQLLAGAASELKGAGLRRINVSLDSLDGVTYAALTDGGQLEKTIAGIDEARRAGLDPVKINAVILRGRNDHEVVDLVRFAMDRGCTIRFLELMPIGCARAFFERLFVPAAEVRARLMAHFDLSPLTSEPGRTSREYRASDAAGRYGVVGFIAPESERFCAGCARLRLTSTGRIIRCLARNDGPSVKPLLGSESRAAIAALQRIVADEIDRKRAPASFGSASPMVSVGG